MSSFLVVRSAVDNLNFTEASKLLRRWPANFDVVDSQKHTYVHLRRTENNTSNNPVKNNSIAGLADGSKLVLDGFIDNLAEITPEAPESSATVEEKLLALREQLGREFVKQLRGDFSIVILRPSGELEIYRDHLGVRPLYYVNTQSLFAVATNVATLLSLPSVSNEINFQWLADFVMQKKISYTDTFYRDITVFPPACTGVFHQGNFQANTYWELSTKTNASLSLQEAVSLYRSKLELAVARRISKHTATACELSGGLDSSSISMLAAKLSKQSNNAKGVELYSVQSSDMAEHFEGSGATLESEYANAVAEAAEFYGATYRPIRNHRGNIFDALRESADLHASPVRRDFASRVHDIVAQLKERGVSVLLSGLGGDHGVTSQQLGYDCDLFREEPESSLQPPVVAKRSRFWFIPSVLRRRLSAAKARWSNRGDYLEFFNQRLALKDFVRSNGYPERARLSPIVQRSGKTAAKQKYLIISAELSYRLLDSSVSAEYHGFNYRYPLLDIDLLEAYQSIPAKYKAFNGWKRVLVREAMTGLLPEDVRLRNDKTGASIPTVFLHLRENRSRILSLLNNMKSNPIFTELYDPSQLASEYEVLTEKFRPSSTKRDFIRALCLALFLESECGQQLSAGLK